MHDMEKILPSFQIKMHHFLTQWNFARQGRGDAKAEFYDFFKEALAVILTAVHG